MVGPSVSTRTRLHHQQVPLVSPPDEDTVHQAEERVRQDESAFCAGAEKEQAIDIVATETMGSGRSSPGSMVCADAGVEVTQDNHLIRLRHTRQEGMQVPVEFVSYNIRNGHRWSVYADDDGEFVSPKRQTEAHQAIVDGLRQTGQSSYDAAPDGKGNTRVPTLCLGATAPAEGEADTHLLQLALFGEPVVFTEWIRYVFLDQDYTCPHCDRTFTSQIGLVSHLRIHRTVTGEPVPGAPTYTHRTRLHCPHCPRTFTHRMGLLGYMGIHKSGIDRPPDSPTTPNPIPTSLPIITSSPITLIATDTDTTDFACPHRPCALISRLGLVGHLRIHSTETGEPVPGAPTYIHQAHLHCPH
nr:unnamed protein product [Spirometra erinaceieuropaei]